MRARHPGPGLAVLSCARGRGLEAWTRAEERRGQLQGSGEEEAVAAPGWLTVLESVLEASRHQREESGETRSRDRAELPDHGGSVSPASVRPLPPLRQPGQGYTDHT